MKRRDFFKNIGNVGAMGAGAMALNMMSNHAKADSASSYGQSMGQSLSGPYIDLTTGPGNKVGYARLNGDLDESKQKYGWFKGFIMAIRPN